MEYDEDIKSSKFNAGVLQTQRINEILSLLNFCKLNPLAFNIDQNDWNYKLVLGCINNLYGEVEGFLTLEESRAIRNIKERINRMLKDNPIHESNNAKYVNVSNWEVIKRALEFYESYVKRYGVKYKILSAFERQAGRI